MGTCSSMRRRMMMSGGEERPLYDAEIEWLQGDGNSYIDTGVFIYMNRLKNANEIIYETELEAQGSGTRAEGKNFQPYFFIGLSSNYWYCGFGDAYYNVRNVAVSSGFHTVKLIWSQDQKGLYVDNVLAQNLSGAKFTASGLTGNFGIYRTFVSSTYRFPQKKKRAKMTIDGNILFDYIPVRKGSVGYMYDRVSGQLFGNAGTGSFILGADV